MKITVIKVNKNGGPEEDQGFVCVVWRPEARQDWFSKPFVSIGTGFTGSRKLVSPALLSHSGLVHLW